MILGLPDPLFFSSDPDSTCNNGYIELFEQNINQNQQIQAKDDGFFYFELNSDPELDPDLDPIFFLHLIPGKNHIFKKSLFSNDSKQKKYNNLV